MSPKVPASLCVVMAPHAELHRTYVPGSGFRSPPGSVPGDYGPKDPATGARYKCLGEAGNRRGIISHSSDHQPGAFYPAAPFFYGDGSDGEPLGFEALEALCLRVLGMDPAAALPFGCKRILLPRGTEGGRLTWQPALMPSVFENGKYAWGLGGDREPAPAVRIRKAWPGAEVHVWNASFDRGRVDAFLPLPEAEAKEASP